MNRKALLALLLAAMVPAVSYLLVKYFSNEAVHMPQRYFHDSVIATSKNGRTFNDTVWHKVDNLKLVNQLGDSVNTNDLRGKIVVVDFFFTRCPTLCPQLARAMKKLQSSFVKNDSIVQFLSISVDPEHDSVKRLKTFGDHYQVDPSSWWLASGNKKEIYSFAFRELKADVTDTDIDTGFIHTPNFYLLDKEGIIRGWYDGSDSTAQARLVRDIPLLMLEKDRKKTFTEFLKELFGRS